nr:putative RNA-directed DNA polymerase, eukaryota, reverse transcriptase zinc-binding domain protein [Tanacetum cinerariifolium]
MCLHSARASVLVNGSPTREFSIKRGLCQGDPLSLFLFIIVMEGLHYALKDAVSSGLLCGTKVGNTNFNISHLFYPDDVGGSDDKRKLSWIKWDNILASFYKDSLWVRVIQAIHGDEAAFDLKGCNNSGDVVDSEKDYQKELQMDAQEDKLTTAMVLLARAITQKFYTPTNNHLRTSSNIRNQAIIHDGRVDIQTKNAGYGGNGNRNAGRQNKNQATNAENGQCYNCNARGRYARDCPKHKVRDAKMEKTRFKPKDLLPYGMLFTRLFKHVVSVSPELAFDHYLSHDRAMHPLAPHYERKTRADQGKKRPRESNASSSLIEAFHPFLNSKIIQTAYKYAL